jgi:hypothetical protein
MVRLLLAGPMITMITSPSLADDANVYRLALKSYAVVVVKEGTDRWLRPAICLDSDKRIFLTAFSTVKDDEEVTFIFPLYDKAGDVVYSSKEYLQLIEAGRWIKGKACIVGRDSKRRLAVLQLPEVPAETLSLKIASSPPKIGDKGIRVAIGPRPTLPWFTSSEVRIGKDWELTVEREDLRQERVTVRGWLRRGPATIEGICEPYLNEKDELIGVLPEPLILGGKGTINKSEILGPTDIASALEDMKIIVGKTKSKPKK